MDVQEVLLYVILGLAVVFLLRKFVFKPKNKKGNCDSDCGCN
jgi:predicted small secreted protein